MATIRIPEKVWRKTYTHLFDKEGEHFAFFLASWSFSDDQPIFLVSDAMLIPDSDLTYSVDGIELTLNAILKVINTAAKLNVCLIEVHNHDGTYPRFSRIDREGLREFIQYIHESLPDRPYGATVWSKDSVYGEYFLPNGCKGGIESITALGSHLSQIASRNDDLDPIQPIFDRQLPWFSDEGQRRMEHLRIGVVGCGGTGSYVIQELTYLGCRDFVLVDDDINDVPNMNRQVTATIADIGTPKVILGRRQIKSIAPNARVLALDIGLQSAIALNTLKSVDVIFGCVDNDGARLILNELALAFWIPYIDLAVGIDAAEGAMSSAGGRVAVILPDRSCLYCMGEIDPTEAAYFLSTPDKQAEDIARGYVTGMDVTSPSVVSLNGVVASIAVSEFAILISGVRPVNALTEYDLLGTGRAIKSQWVSPVRVHADHSCVQCSLSGIGDKANLERYVKPDKLSTILEEEQKPSMD